MEDPAAISLSGTPLAGAAAMQHPMVSGLASPSQERNPIYEDPSRTPYPSFSTPADYPQTSAYVTDPSVWSPHGLSRKQSGQPGQPGNISTGSLHTSAANLLNLANIAVAAPSGAGNMSNLPLGQTVQVSPTYGSVPGASVSPVVPQSVLQQQMHRMSISPTTMRSLEQLSRIKKDVDQKLEYLTNQWNDFLKRHSEQTYSKQRNVLYELLLIASNIRMTSYLALVQDNVQKDLERKLTRLHELQISSMTLDWNYGEFTITDAGNPVHSPFLTVLDVVETCMALPGVDRAAAMVSLPPQVGFSTNLPASGQAGTPGQAKNLHLALDVQGRLQSSSNTASPHVNTLVSPHSAESPQVHVNKQMYSPAARHETPVMYSSPRHGEVPVSVYGQLPEQYAPPGNSGETRSQKVSPHAPTTNAPASMYQLPLSAIARSSNSPSNPSPVAVGPYGVAGVPGAAVTTGTGSSPHLIKPGMASSSPHRMGNEGDANPSSGGRPLSLVGTTVLTRTGSTGMSKGAGEDLLGTEETASFLDDSSEEEEEGERSTTSLSQGQPGRMPISMASLLPGKTSVHGDSSKKTTSSSLYAPLPSDYRNKTSAKVYSPRGSRPAAAEIDPNIADPDAASKLSQSSKGDNAMPTLAMPSTEADGQTGAAPSGSPGPSSALPSMISPSPRHNSRNSSLHGTDALSALGNTLTDIKLNVPNLVICRICEQPIELELMAAHSSQCHELVSNLQMFFNRTNCLKRISDIVQENMSAASAAAAEAASTGNPPVLESPNDLQSQFAELLRSILHELEHTSCTGTDINESMVAVQRIYGATLPQTRIPSWITMLDKLRATLHSIVTGRTPSRAVAATTSSTNSLSGSGSISETPTQDEILLRLVEICLLLLKNIRDAIHNLVKWVMASPISSKLTASWSTSPSSWNMKELMQLICKSADRSLTAVDDGSSRALPNILHFDILKPISSGAFGRVYLARKKSTGDIFAIKVLRKQDDRVQSQTERVQLERDILANVSSPSIVRFFWSFTTSQKLFLVMEYVPGGDMYSLLCNLGFLDEDVARQYMSEIILALEYLHGIGIVHRDLKPDNVLINREGRVVLTDFGLSKLAPVPKATDKTARTVRVWEREVTGRLMTASLAADISSDQDEIVGTPDYLAPELLLGKHHSFPVDWWALGVVLYEFLMGIPPFHDASPERIFENILDGSMEFPIAPDEMSYEALDLLQRLLEPDPGKRLGSKGGAEEVKAHPFFAGVDWDNVHQKKATFIPEIHGEEDTSYFCSRNPIEDLSLTEEEIRSIRETESEKPHSDEGSLGALIAELEGKEKEFQQGKRKSLILNASETGVYRDGKYTDITNTEHNYGNLVTIHGPAGTAREGRRMESIALRRVTTSDYGDQVFASFARKPAGPTASTKPSVTEGGTGTPSAMSSNASTSSVVANQRQPFSLVSSEQLLRTQSFREFPFQNFDNMKAENERACKKLLTKMES